jgi:8-oxo-dGTP diphosphatase
MAVALVILTADIAIFRNTDDGDVEILLIQRRKSPYAGFWALPGGKMDAIDFNLQYTAIRETLEETGIWLNTIKFINLFSNINRDSRGRYVSGLYIAKVDSNTQPIAGSDAKAIGWFSLRALPQLAFDHKEMIEAAVKEFER